MAKKILFKSVNAETVATINTINEVVFTHALVSKELYAEGKKLEKELEFVKGAIALGSDLGEKKDKLENSIRVIGFKKKALVSWRKSALYNTKDDSDKWVDGLYTSVGVTKELCETWADCMSAQTWGKWNEHIRKMLADVYGMNIKDDKLVARFASYLEHAIGLDLGSTNDILKGVLLKDKKSFNKFAETFIRAIATYMAKSCEDVYIPTVEFNTASVEYDENYRKVTNYKVAEKETEEEVAEETKEETVA